VSNSQFDYGARADPFSADALAGLPPDMFGTVTPGEDFARAIRAILGGSDRRSASPLAPDALQNVSTVFKTSPKDQSRMQQGAPAALPLPVQIASAVAQPATEDPFADLLPGAEPKAAAASAASGDDPFADLIPQTPNATISGKPASPLYDAFRSGMTGLRSGAEGLAGMIGDVGRGVNWVKTSLARSTAMTRRTRSWRP
jgi:hypothetical protein